MKIVRYRIASTVEVTIKKGLFKSISLSIPIRRVMYMFSDPNNWKEIDKLSIDKQVFGDVANMFDEMMQTKHGQTTLCELLLKVAGQHPNPIENNTIRQIILNHENSV